MLDYIVSLREGIMDAWGGIVIALRAGNKGECACRNSSRSCADCADLLVASLLAPYIDTIFQLLQTVYQDPNRTEALLRASMGVVG